MQKKDGFLTLFDIDCKNKRVLVRVDYNVPLEDGVVKDETRIKETVLTLEELLKKGAKQLVICSHLGRPNGKVVKELSLKPIAACLSKFMNQPVHFQENWLGKSLPKDTIILLENLRFFPQEEKNDDVFAKSLATLGDVFVSDAFGTLHRAHASTVGVTKYLESYAGLLVEKELMMLSKLNTPSKPYMAVLGGAKISDKLAVIKNLLPKVDKLLVGGAMAFTFFKAKGWEVGTSKVEDDFLPQAKELMKNKKLMLPIDIVVSSDWNENARIDTCAADKMPKGWMGLDIGPKTVKMYQETIQDAKTIVWNGPMGVFEWAAFYKGTLGIAKAIAENKNAFSLIGGGDSARAINDFGMNGKYSHVSTGGGASLEYLEGKKLPGVAALEEWAKK